jgi:hypothetical protein
MEQVNMYNTVTRTVGIKTYLCPGRGRAPTNGTAFPGGPVTDYALNIVTAGGGGFTPLTARISMSQVSAQNGTSDTILVGEKAMDPNNYSNNNTGWDECIYEGDGGCSRAGNLIVRDAVGNSYGGNWGSPFGSGTPFLMCDGSVRFINYSLSGAAAFNCALNWKNTTPFSLDS